MTTHEPKTAEPSQQDLRAELRRAYDTLSEITGRLLLANEAADAALSTHDRTELSERFLQVASRGMEVLRAALLLPEGDGFTVVAAVGLSTEEQEALASSAADAEAFRSSMRARSLRIVDPDLVSQEVLDAETRHDGAAVEETSDEEDEDEGAGEEESENDEDEGEDEAEDDETEDEDEDEEVEEEEDLATSNGDPVTAEAPASAGRPILGVYLPAYLEDRPAAVLALGERARGLRYQEDDLVFLHHLLRQFSLAVNRSVLIEQNEERLRELGALLRVSREITSTLDLDAVLRAVVNTVAAVVENDRAEIALVRGGRLVLRAISGMTRLEPDQAEIFRLERPLEYLRLNPVRLHLAADDLGGEHEPPGGAVFTEYFENQEMRSFMGLPLRDEQGLLGFLCLESKLDAWDLKPAEGDTLDILAAQTTVAIRNAHLYTEIPLRGVSLPMFKLRSLARGLDAKSRAWWIAAAVGALLLLVTPVFPERAGGPAEVRPLRFLGARALTEGNVSRVLVKGGEEVRAGQPLAVLEDLELSGRIAQLRGEIETVRREVAGARQRGDVAPWRSGEVRLAALQRTLGYEEQRASATVLVAPFAGQVLELDLAQRVGQHLEAGDSFCTVAALDLMAADVEVSEDKIGRVRVGQPVSLKVMAFPARTFRGRVTEVGWRGSMGASGSARFLVRSQIENQGRALRPGMTGVGKTSLGRRALAALALEPLGRALQLWWW